MIPDASAAMDPFLKHLDGVFVFVAVTPSPVCFGCCAHSLALAADPPWTAQQAQQRTARTRAPVHMEPMLSMRTSFLLSFVTFPCFSPLCTPANPDSSQQLFNDPKQHVRMFFRTMAKVTRLRQGDKTPPTEEIQMTGSCDVDTVRKPSLHI